MKLFYTVLLFLTSLLFCKAQTKQKCYETIVTPAVFATETIEIEVTPAYYETVYYQFTIKPAYMAWSQVGSKWCQVERPAVTKTASKKVLKTAAVMETVTKYVLVSPETIETVLVACQ